MTEKKEKITEPEEWTAVGFLDEFKRIDETMKDRAFAFILGAGASVSSKIPTGAALAKRWVEEIYRLKVGNNGKNPVEEWATEENLDIEGFSWERTANFYPQIYARRFADDPESGYAYLENEMKAAEPNVGYSVLAQVLAKTRHKTIITTNFDNLIADALSLYTDTFPLVCGHESLAGFARPKLRRPLVAKIHRDLLFAPKSDVDGTSKLEDTWANVLIKLFNNFTPIVIGYGGNDGSLMEFLENLEQGSILGGIYWCYRWQDGKPKDHIRRLVAKHKGKLIPIHGFDEFMIQLNQTLGFELLDEQIERQAKKRADTYREQFKKFQENLTKQAVTQEAEEALRPVRKAFAETVTKEKSWWGWELKAREETDPDKREMIYKAGLNEFPDSHELIANFALFLDEIRKDYDQAEKLYLKALELDPNNANNLGNFACFMDDIRKDYDQAEKLYLKALELDPNNATNLGNFASFIEIIRKDYDQAEKLYLKALGLDPNNATNLGNFAGFIKNIRKHYDQAEKLYLKALELDPNNAIILGNFANFIKNVHKNYDQAKKLYLKALDLNPNHAINLGNYALFLIEKREFNKASDLIKKAFEANLADGKAAKKDLELELWFYCYAAFFNEYKDADKEIEALLEEGVTSPGWNLKEVLKVAEELNHPDLEKLRLFEKRITEEKR